MLFDPAGISIDNPRYLYKYYADNEYALSSLANRLFWFSDPTSFNDPLDCHFDLREYLDAPIEEKILWADILLAYLRTVEPEFQGFRMPQEVIFVVDHFLMRLAEAVRSAGVFCLSATPFEVLMWSHYADKHTGFCVEFEREPHNELGKHSCNPIQYTDTPHIFRFGEGMEAFSINEAKDPAMLVLHSKTVSWVYEKEWRVVYLPRPGGASAAGLHRLSARISSIIFGLKSKKPTIEAVTSVMKNQGNCEFYQMELVPRTLKLRPRLIGV